MESTQEAPRDERIARQGYIWLDARKALIGDSSSDEKERAERRERRKLAIVLDEERER